MPLKSIITFLFFSLLSVYFSFLNPHEVDIHFSQGRSLRLPMVVLFLGSVLLGVLVAGLLHGTLSLKSFFSNLKVIRRNKRQDKTSRQVEMLLEKAENLIACGYISKAVPIYEKILNLSPNHVGVLTRLGNTFRDEGNPTRALEFHLRAVQAAPKNLDVLYSLADDYLAKAMCPMEMETLEKISKLDRTSPRVFYRMKEVYLKSKDWAMAVDVQRKLIARIEGKDKKEKEKKILVRYIYNNGVQYFNNGNFESAILEFKKALRENSQCLSAYVTLGDAHLKTGNVKAALQAWKTGHVNTNSPVCLMRMEKSFSESGQAEEMIKEYKEAIKDSKNSTRKILSLLLGALCLEEGKPQETIKVIEENEDFQKSIIHSLILADAYKQQQNETQSQQAVANASHQIKDAILNFKCSACGQTMDEWADNCSACNAFDKIECRPGVNSW